MDLANELARIRASLQKISVDYLIDPDYFTRNDRILDERHSSDEEESMICPHCDRGIDKKDVWHDGYDFYHRPCVDSGPLHHQNRLL